VRGEIHYTGNTIVDALFQNLKIAKRKSKILDTLKLKPKTYAICTTHREENVDNRSRLKCIFKGLKKMIEKLNMPVYLPLHPRTRKRISEFGYLNDIAETSDFFIIEPLGYLDFLILLANASIILTDSGGIQEESCVLEIPCVTLRENTERPETLAVGANYLAGTNPEKIVEIAIKMKSREKGWKNPFGDGRASERIVDVMQNVLENGCSLYNIELCPRYVVADSFLKSINDLTKS
jgi:UDP-N-acetylglucosamine 2-epimerase (non-hydrolysing)